VRRGREFYSRNYNEVIELYKKGLSTREIADRLGISYSCVYHWVRGLRKPESGNLMEFENFLKQNGPTPVIDIKERFPKHNEIFLTAIRRNVPIRRYRLSRKFGEFSTFYFISGQEGELKKRIKELTDKYKELRKKLVNMIGG
jgi:predicted DNA-binding protein YlxM (UPF0122 family)